MISNGLNRQVLHMVFQAGCSFCGGPSNMTGFHPLSDEPPAYAAPYFIYAACDACSLRPDFWDRLQGFIAAARAQLPLELPEVAHG